MFEKLFGSHEGHTVKGPILFIWISVLILGASGLLLMWVSTTETQLESSFTHMLLVLAGIVAMLSALAGVALALQHHGLSDHEFALGLPKGSVRAILALGLLLVFLGLAIFLYTSLPDGQPELLTQQKVTSLPAKEDLPDGVFAVEVADAEGNTSWEIYTVPNEETKADLAQQMFTTIATVLVTIIGFYFGNRSLTPFDSRAMLRDEEKNLSVRVQEGAARAEAARERTQGAAERARSARDELEALLANESDTLRKAAIEEEIKTLNERLGTLDAILEEAKSAAQTAAAEAEKAIVESDVKKAEASATKTEKAARQAESASERATDIATFAEGTVARLKQQ